MPLLRTCPRIPGLPDQRNPNGATKFGKYPQRDVSCNHVLPDGTPFLHPRNKKSKLFSVNLWSGRFREGLFRAA